MSSVVRRFYRFGGFRLDTSEHLLYRQDAEVVPLKPKVIETLELLVQERGRLISKDELMAKLWPDTIVEESNLSQNIYLLRKVLGTDGRGRNYIENIPKRGYRFTAEVEEVSEAPETATLPPPQLQSTATPSASMSSQNQPLGATLNSLAVLPFVNDSADPNIEYLSDGITESIINRLSRLSQLRVMARSTVFHYKEQQISPREVGRQLGVQTVLAGRLLQFGEQLIVRTELVDAVNGWHLWGGQYERRPSDILELQETLAQDISEQLQLKLTGHDQKQLSKRFTESAEAYHPFIKARYHLNKRLTEPIQKAAEYFQQAIDVDPSFALAYSGLADCYPLLSLYGALTPHEAYPKAKAAALRALEIEESLAEAHNSLAVIKLFYEWDWEGAESAFRRALELNPNYADAHQRFGMLLVTRGRFAEATAELERASALDPLSLITKTISGYPFYYARDYARAAERFRQVIEMDHNYSMAHFRLGLTCAQEGLYDEAIAELGQSSQLSGDRDTIAALGYVYGRSGQLSEARAALAELEVREQKGFVSSYNRVLVHLGLGDAEAALDWLEKAYEERSYWLIYLEVDPALDPLRDHPRFASLRDKVLGEGNPAGNPVVAKTAPVTMPGSQPSRWRRVFAPLLVLLLIGAGLAFVTKRFVWRDVRSSNHRPPLPFQNFRLKRITDSGDVADAALSPDGKSVAFVTNRSVVWIQNLATGSRLQLFAESEKEERRGLAFSPDGNQLYFYQGFEHKKLQLMRVSVLGGQPERLLEDFNTWTAIAPDGKRFAFIRWHLERGEQSLIIADRNSERTLITRKIPDYFELWGKTVAWSPDGKLIACIEGLKQNNTTTISVLIVNAADGSEVRLPNQGRNWNQLYDLTWLTYGNGLLVSAREDSSSTNQIWRVSYPEGEWRKVQNDLNDYEKLSVSADNGRIVAVQKTDFSNLWLLPKGELKSARQLTFGNGRTDGWGGLSWTPDGKIVYASNASGSRQIWIADESGANLRQLTFSTEASTQPFVSPDGRYVVFTSYRDHKPHIWRMDVDGANAFQLTDGPGESWPAVTPDGHDVTYTSESSPYSTTWSIPIVGGVAPTQLASGYSLSQANPSPDGKLLAAGFYDANSQSPWRLGVFPSTGGQPITSFDTPVVNLPGWTADSQSVVFLDQHHPYLWQQSIQGGAPFKLLSLTLPERIYNFALSRDNSSLVIARGRPQSDALLIEDIK